MVTIFVVHHDSVTEGKQFEELCNFLVLPGSDACNQVIIHELEFSVCELVPAPVHWLKGKNSIIELWTSEEIILNHPDDITEVIFYHASSLLLLRAQKF